MMHKCKKLTSSIVASPVWHANLSGAFTPLFGTFVCSSDVQLCLAIHCTTLSTACNVLLLMIFDIRFFLKWYKQFDVPVDFLDFLCAIFLAAIKQFLLDMCWDDLDNQIDTGTPPGMTTV